MSNHASRVVSKLQFQQFQGFQRFFHLPRLGPNDPLPEEDDDAPEVPGTRGQWTDPFGTLLGTEILLFLVASCCCKPWIIWICVLDLAQFLTRTASFSTMAATALGIPVFGDPRWFVARGSRGAPCFSGAQMVSTCRPFRLYLPQWYPLVN